MTSHGQYTQTRNDIHTHIYTHLLKERRNKLAPGRLGGIFICKFHSNLVQTTFPIGTLLAGNTHFPRHEIHRSVRVGNGPGVKAKGMVSSPILSFFRQTSLCDTRHCFVGVTTSLWSVEREVIKCKK